MRTSLARPLAFAVSLGLAGALAGCGGGGGASSPTVAAQSTGQLSVGLTDGPIDDASEVVVKFTGIELKPQDGNAFTVDVTKSVDLLKLQNGATTDLLNGHNVPAGRYEWIRLIVSATQNVPDSYIKLATNGGMYPLYVPSGMESGLKLVRPFSVAQGGATNLLVDFDLRKSVTAPPGQQPNYMLKPALRLMDRLQVGKIAATVDLRKLTTAQFDANTAITTCKAGLYLYPASQTAPDDMYDAATTGNPVVYLPVPYDGVNATPTVNIPFVEAGSYRLAATCNYDKDSASKDDYKPDAPQGDPLYQTMKWTAFFPATVTANATTSVALP
jgi:hypothetical protein